MAIFLQIVKHKTQKLEFSGDSKRSPLVSI